ncbi:Hypothetical predicted protein [Cloeon dipterum]|uniref:ZBR-type domain-containing protein n=1 Tax=Cloeon dipterum TaxID=197152 RepID=A0A8S1D3K0_9INSE|nr:Hypothetical predicted protein [Cloeon dipterum]
MKLTTPHGSENLLVPFEVAESRRQHRHFGTPLNSRVPFRQPDFSSPSPLPVSPSKISRIDRFEAFRLMGNGLLSGEAQLSCPLCDLPARKEGNKTVGVCTNCQCRFRFCQNCRGEEHGMSQCRLLLTPEKLIGARLASRKHYLKNMKRLNLS